MAGFLLLAGTSDLCARPMYKIDVLPEKDAVVWAGHNPHLTGNIRVVALCKDGSQERMNITKPIDWSKVCIRHYGLAWDLN